MAMICKDLVRFSLVTLEFMMLECVQQVLIIMGLL